LFAGKAGRNLSIHWIFQHWIYEKIAFFSPFSKVTDTFSQETRNVSLLTMEVRMELCSLFEEKTLRVFPSIDP